MSGGGRRRYAPNAPGLHVLRPDRAARLVAASGVSAADLVLDLGAGTGALTGPLAATGARVVAVERDPRLVRTLRRRFGADGRVRVVEADLRAYAPPREPYRVVANLPFAIVMTALGRLLDDPRSPVRRADLVVPWPVAARLTRADRAPRRARRWYRTHAFRVATRLGPGAFVPPPSVDAAVLVVERRR